jgi:hypothetical protein
MHAPLGVQRSGEVAEGPEQPKHLFLVVHQRACALLDGLGPVPLMIMQAGALAVKYVQVEAHHQGCAAAEACCYVPLLGPMLVEGSAAVCKVLLLLLWWAGLEEERTQKRGDTEREHRSNLDHQQQEN